MLTKKEKFIDEVKTAIYDTGNDIEEWFSPEALEFWKALQLTDEKQMKFTENGKKILIFMQEHKDEFDNLFKAKDIGERIEISSRAVSGAIRKLVNDGYVEKIGQNPVIYTLTTLGTDTKVE